jgi:hypothetical protein
MGVFRSVGGNDAVTPLAAYHVLLRVTPYQ